MFLVAYANGTWSSSVTFCWHPPKVRGTKLRHIAQKTLPIGVTLSMDVIKRIVECHVESSERICGCYNILFIVALEQGYLPIEVECGGFVGVV